MASGFGQLRRGVFLFSLVASGLPSCFSIRVPLTLEDNSTDPNIEHDESAPGESRGQSELVKGAVTDDNGNGHIQTVWEHYLDDETLDTCEKKRAAFAQFTADAACPILERVMNPGLPNDTLQYLHFRCDLNVPLRRCYELIPAGVGSQANLMPSASTDWRQFSRLFWPSQGLLDWRGMEDHVPGTHGPVTPSKGWEWLARRTGNCGNCWSEPSALATQLEQDVLYVKSILATVPVEDIRTMLDMGGGAGNVGAVLSRDYNITVISDNLDFDAPFLETIAARGSLSLSFNMMRRFPFVEGSFDVVHSRTTPTPRDVDRFLAECDRLVRPGGYIILHSTHAGLRRAAARLALEEKKSEAWSFIYRKPMERHQVNAASTAASNAKLCDSMECLCKKRLESWKLAGEGLGACAPDAEATWHWISQHCLHLGTRISEPLRCAAAEKVLPGDGRRSPPREPCELFNTLTQTDLPFSTDALRTVLDVEGDGALVANLQSAFGTQGMVLGTDLHTLNLVASRGVVGLQGSLNTRQPFTSGAFDMIHIRAKSLHASYRAHNREESFSPSVGDLSWPAPLPDLHELIYEMDRLVRPGGFVVISLDQQTLGVPEILNDILKKLGWKRRPGKQEKILAFARPSTGSEQQS